MTHLREGATKKPFIRRDAIIIPGQKRLTISHAFSKSTLIIGWLQWRGRDLARILLNELNTTLIHDTQVHAILFNHICTYCLLVHLFIESGLWLISLEVCIVRETKLSATTQVEEHPQLEGCALPQPWQINYNDKNKIGYIKGARFA